MADTGPRQGSQNRRNRGGRNRARAGQQEGDERIWDLPGQHNGQGRGGRGLHTNAAPSTMDDDGIAENVKRPRNMTSQSDSAGHIRSNRQEGRLSGGRGGMRGAAGGRGGGGSNVRSGSSSAPYSNGAAQPASFEASLNRRDPTAPASTQAATDLRFADIPGLSSPTKAAMSTGFGYEFATVVQKATIQPALEGKDMIARAQTGTGKTLGFMIPAIERVHARVPSGARTASHVVVVSPTRELASQIAAEASVVCKHHGNAFGVQLLVGGTNRASEARRLSSGPNTVVVCTVGRFHDHVENTTGFRQIMSSVSVVVLDECDRLLEMGFKQEVEKLLRVLPKPGSRQTLLFSATMPAQVSKLTDLALRKDHVYIDCVGEAAPETATLAEQTVAVVPKEEWLPRLSQVLSEGTQQSGYKIMVFGTTARTAGFLADFFTAAGLPGVSQIHSRMSQSARTKASNAFRGSNGGVVMFTSDVSARGVDYPGTTLVVQVGLPSSRETYVHRLGRTARAGEKGRGILLLCDYEAQFLKKTLAGLPITNVELGAMPKEGVVEWFDAVQRVRSRLNTSGELVQRANQAYVAWMGYMNGNLRILGWGKPQLVQEAATFAGQLGLAEIPAMEKRTVGKMGLKGVPGLRIA